jgi:lambda family phage tail tape measure protein
MATLETIRQLTIRGRSDGLERVASDLAKVDAAQRAVTGSAAPLAVATDTVAKRVTSSAGAYDRLRQSIDLDYRAQVQMEKGQRTINAALEQGIIDAQAAAAAVDMLTAKYARMDAALAAKSAREAEIAVLRAQQAGQNFNQDLSASFAPGGKSARDSASVFEEVARAEQLMAKEAAQLRAQINPLGAAMDRLNAEMAQYASLAASGAINTDELVQAQALAQSRFDMTAVAIGKTGSTSIIASHQMANLSFQLNDIVSGLAMGQSPFMILAQQGGQVVQIFQQSPGGVGGVMRAAAASVWAFLGPIGLLSVGLAAAGTAAAVYFTEFPSGAKEADAALKKHEETIRRLKDAYEEATEKSGAFVAEARAVAELKLLGDRLELKATLDDLSKGLIGTLDLTARMNANMKGADLAPFEGALQRLYSSIREGNPNFVAFNLEMNKIGTSRPELVGLSNIFQKLVEPASEVARALNDNAHAMDTVGAAAARNQKSLDAYTDALKTLAGIALPDFSDQDAILNAMSTGFKNARGPKDILDILTQGVGAADRLNISQVPLPRVNPTRDLTTWDRESEKTAGRTANAYRDLVKNANDRIEQLRVEIETVGMADAAAEKYRMQQELLASATDKGRSVSEPMRKEIEKIADEYARLAEEVARARLQQDLLFDRRQLGRSAIDQTVAATLRGAGLPEDLNSTEAQMIRFNEQLAISKSMSMDFASTFISGLREGQTILESFGNALNRIADKLIEMATDQLISGLFGNIMGAFGGGMMGTGGLFANGAAFAGGNVIPFARGGVVDRPTLFPMSAGRTGVMGEAGEEAIMPLRRLSTGRLGVEAVGGGQGGNVITFAPRTTITVQGNAGEDTLAKLKAELDKRDRTLKEQIPGLVTKAQVRGHFPGRG